MTKIRFSEHKWLIVFSLTYGTFVVLPFIAPALMHIGWEQPANLIYSFYSFLCHQLPQRSFFLFGQKSSYSLNEIRGAWQDTLNPLLLRQFIGSAEMGWKVAWSDRMASMYGSILPIAWLWYPMRRKVKGLPLWAFLILLVPMALDGGTHLISDLAGLGQGFRDSNEWLVNLTGGIFSQNFYAGDVLGSFNSWMRIITGFLFGLAIIFFTAPLIAQEAFERKAIILPGSPADSEHSKSG